MTCAFFGHKVNGVRHIWQRMTTTCLRITGVRSSGRGKVRLQRRADTGKGDDTGEMDKSCASKTVRSRFRSPPKQSAFRLPHSSEVSCKLGPDVAISLRNFRVTKFPVEKIKTPTKLANSPARGGLQMSLGRGRNILSFVWRRSVQQRCRPPRNSSSTGWRSGPADLDFIAAGSREQRHWQPF